MSALSRAPLVFTSHGETEVDDGRLFQSSLYARSAFRVVSRTAAALTVPSEWVANHAARLSAPFANAVVIPNGIDPSQWPLLSTVEAPVAAAWGRHVRQKGFDLLLQAWPLVVREQPGARLLLGGDGPDTNTLKAIGGPGVEFLGPLDRGGVRDLLAQSRVAVVPSRVEPFGIVALEAMATGRSVVWGTYGGLRDATGGLGTPVDPTDVQALARGVLEELRSPADASSCRHHALSLSLDRMTEHYLDVYAGAVR
jgi:glycosyltransferase involved in cell wall biosynthesis